MMRESLLATGYFLLPTSRLCKKRYLKIQLAESRNIELDGWLDGSRSDLHQKIDGFVAGALSCYGDHHLINH